ncbi:uncharacterized protein LOC125944626 [Dermacentor silvarum]|uniref:uncharacterized protein LOC125944626 n=1 Tax=Dermacentor silvarum TaxID=543639 RepID=UPI002100B4EF|nr:uncharacterized protein LOC125944626 [Dermacentor silvarum]
MTERSESPPRRLSAVNPSIGVAAAPVLSTTPHYSGVASPPAYGVFAPYTMAAQNSYPGGQPALSTAYHYGPAPGAGMWQQQQQPGAPLVAPVQLTGLCQSGLPAPLPQPVFVRKETIADLARSNLSSPRRQSARRSDKPCVHAPEVRSVLRLAAVDHVDGGTGNGGFRLQLRSL